MGVYLLGGLVCSDAEIRRARAILDRVTAG
jgi:hypothetical protein